MPYSGETISYASMNEKQLSWYLYWRTEMRKNNPLPNQVPYLLLYGLETLHLVGVSSENKAIEPFMHLLEHYSEEDVFLDGFLLGSLFDHCVYYQFPFHPMLAVADIYPSDPTHVEYLMNIAAKLETTDFFNIPPYMVELLSDFPLEKTRLHQGSPSAGFDIDDSVNLLMTTTSFTLVHFHLWLVENEKIGFFDKYATIEEGMVSFHLFRNIPSLEEKNYEVSMRCYAEDDGLCHTVTEFVRLTENILREYFGVRGRLRQIDLAPEVQEFVKTVIEERLAQMNGKDREEPPSNIIPFPTQ